MNESGETRRWSVNSSRELAAGRRPRARTLRELSPEFQRVTGIYTSSLHANDDYSKAERETTPGIQMTERKLPCRVTTGSDTSRETQPHEATALQRGTEKSLLDGQCPQVERTQKILVSCLCQPQLRHNKDMLAAS